MWRKSAAADGRDLDVRHLGKVGEAHGPSGGPNDFCDANYRLIIPSTGLACAIAPKIAMSSRIVCRRALLSLRSAQTTTTQPFSIFRIARSGPGVFQQRWRTSAPREGDGPLMERRADRELPGTSPASVLSPDASRLTSSRHLLRHLQLVQDPPHLRRHHRRLLPRHLQLPEILLPRRLLDPLRPTRLPQGPRPPRRRDLLQAPDPLD